MLKYIIKKYHMKKWEIDVPVLITFFVRDEVLEPVFESVRQARPSTLLLWQDGPRANSPDDLEGIKRCREIVDKIDWECTVHRNYHDENMGCDPSTFLAQKWAFSIVDKCIIMEDDRVPCQSFFRFCKELLDKYEFDERINHICGTNLLGINESCQTDYFFAPAGSTTWASWKRVAKDWDEKYSYLDDNYIMSCLKSIKTESEYEVISKNALKHRKEGKQYWETILGMGCVLNNRLAIIPQKNMVKDLGNTENATHAIANKNLMPKAYQIIFDTESYDVSFPLKHPKYIIADNNYYREILKLGGIGYPFLRFSRRVESLARHIYYGEFKKLFKGVINRIKK